MTAQAPSLPSPLVSLKVDENDKARSPMQLALQRFRRNRLAVAGLVTVILFIIVAAGADFFSPFALSDTTACSGPINGTSCTAQGDSYQYAPAGTIDHVTGKISILGTDDLGHDILTRIFYGLRISLLVGFVAESVVLVIGVTIGLIAGFFGGWIDNILMRFTEIMYAFPDLLFVILLMTVLGHSVFLIFFAFGLTGWVTMARLVRGQVMQVKNMDFVLGAKSIGARTRGLMVRHIVPNILGPIIVLVTLGIPGYIIAEATLTFLGIGIDPSTPTLGTMISRAQDGINTYPTATLFPALAIAILTLAFTFIGDGVSDMFDPKRK